MDVWFLNRGFQSDPGVLVPRPTGNAQIHLLKNVTEKIISIADVGCGAGHLGITAALEFPEADIILIDNSREAIDNTRDNIKLHQVTERCKVYEEELEDSSHMKVDAIITNLNFVPDHKEIDTIEPASAIYGGPTGMELYESFWEKVRSDGAVVMRVITLCLREQFERMDEFAFQSGYELVERKEYASCYKKV